MANIQGKRKINFLDFLLIVLIIAIVSVAIVSVIRSNPNKISGGDTSINYTVKCEMLNETAAQNIKKGAEIYDNESNQLLGTVTEEPIIEPIMAKDGRKLVQTGKVTVKITVNAQAWKKNNIYSIDDYRISEGLNISFHSTEFSYTGFCTSIVEQ